MKTQKKKKGTVIEELSDRLVLMDSRKVYAFGKTGIQLYIPNAFRRVMDVVADGKMNLYGIVGTENRRILLMEFVEKK